MRSLYLLFFVLLFTISNSVKAQTIFVDSASGQDANLGTAWSSAYKTFSKALSMAQSTTSINTIMVAKGTYYPAGDAVATTAMPDSAFTILRGGLKMYGGYPTGGGAVDTAKNKVYLDGYGFSHHIMIIAGLNASADSVVIDGFTFRNGNASSDTLAYDTKTYNGQTLAQYNGGGMYQIGNANTHMVAVRNCSFVGNNAVYGAGMYNESASPIITNCTFINNMANLGAGIMNYASPLINNCTFLGNKADNGGGIFNFTFLTTISNCNFLGNTASNGGGIYNGFSSSYIANTTLAGNKAANGGVVFNLNSPTTTFTNSTLAGNSATTGGAFYNINSSPYITNSIIYGNSSGIYNDSSITSDFFSNSTVNYSLIQGGYAGTSNTKSDPMFVNAPNFSSVPFTNADYRLKVGSPAINAASNGAYYYVGDIYNAVDLANNPRLFNGIIDAGAYEYQPIVALPVTFLYFTGTQKNTVNILNWSTASEANNIGFYLERSNNAIDYGTISFIPGNGTTNTVQTYSYTDAQPLNGSNFYRLRQTDYNGFFVYSNVVLLNNNENFFHVYPNPATNTLFVNTSGLKGNVQIIDQLGRIVFSQIITGDRMALDVSYLASGSYYCKAGNVSITFVKEK